MMVLVAVIGLLIIVLLVSNALFLTTNFYKNIYWQLAGMENLVTNRKFDYANTGSSYAYFGIDYDSAGCMGLNLALSPQTLYYDYMLLQRYRPMLNEGAAVMIVLCPFVFCVKNYNNSSIDIRYSKLLPHSKIQHFKKLRFWTERHLPLVMHPTNARFLLNDVPKLDVQKAYQMNADEAANIRIQDWKAEFGLTDLSNKNSIPVPIQQIFLYNSCLLHEMIEYVRRNGLRPFIIIPPVTAQLRGKLTNSVLDVFLFQNLKEAGCDDVPVLNYLDDRDLLADHLYYNSDFLNETGRRLFTKKLLKDLENA